MAFEQLNQKKILDNPFYKIYKEDYSLPNGKTGVYYAVRGLRTVFIVPFLDKDTVVLTKQFRYLYQADSWEFPAGRIDEGETKEQAAARELLEESGYQANILKYVGWTAPCNGLSDEKQFIFIAADLTKTKAQPDETEQITTHELPVDEFERMIDNNKARDGMTITAWRLVQEQRNKIFT